MLLEQALKSVFALDSDAGAVEYDGQWWTWGELRRLADAISRIADEARFGDDAPVAILLRNRPSVYAALVSVIESRRCLVTINPMQSPQRIGEDLRSLSAPIIIALESDWALLNLEPVASAIGALGIAVPDAQDGSVAVRLEPAQAQASNWMPPQKGIAIQMLTSGTTGKPKRINLKRSQLETGLLDAAVYEKGRNAPGTRLSAAVEIIQTPFVHIGGIFSVLNAALSGRRICLLDRFTVASWRDAIIRHRPKVAFAPPTALKMILDADLPPEDFASLVALRSATAPLPPAIVDSFLERYNLTVLENYGATEFSGGVAGWTLDMFRNHWPAKRGSVGCLHAGVAARIVDETSFEELPPNHRGLLELRSPQIDSSGGWTRTTDIAKLDEDGFLYICGRSDNAIIRGGFKIQPDDIADALERHETVREAAVIAIPDERLGQVPAAAVVLKSDANEVTVDELKSWVREQLTAYSVPSVLLVLEDMPRTPSMKVSAIALRELVIEAAIR